MDKESIVQIYNEVLLSDLRKMKLCHLLESGGNIKLSEISQSQRQVLHIFSHLWKLGGK
jgi:hypothetical protein